MSVFRNRKVCLLVALAALAAPSLFAVEILVQRMDLGQVCANADKIFSGTVLSAENGTVEAGGGELPTITYVIEVDEAFQGEFTKKGDARYAEITMLGTAKPSAEGGMAKLAGLPEVPRLEVGETYVLMTSTPSSSGLSSPVGMAQGCYHLSSKGDDVKATNALGETLSYEDLAESIRAAIQ